MFCTTWWSTCGRLRDTASAATFSTPGICTAFSTIVIYTRKKCKHLIKCIMSSRLLVFALTISITAALSHRTCTLLWAQWVPHFATASIGSSSLSTILFPFRTDFYSHWIHQEVQTASQPQLPEASELTCDSR